MQNAKCIMHNYFSLEIDGFKLFPKEIPQFCTLHFALCILCVSTINSNLTSFGVIGHFGNGLGKGGAGSLASRLGTGEQTAAEIGLAGGIV